MPLDPQFNDIVKMLGQMPPFSELPLEALRGSPPPAENPVPVVAVGERTIAGPAGDIRLRIYHGGAGDGLPLLFFMHGGGFVLGNLDTHDELARMLAAATASVLVSVDYRLAPENKYPAAVDDCFAALKWTAAHAQELGGDTQRLTVIGDSAGGNLAAVMTLRSRDEGGPALASQVLIYPVTDLTAPMLPAPDGQFYILNPDTRKFFNGSYLRDSEEAKLPYVSPSFAADVTGLPPALVITGEYDPLCEQGEAYALRLRDAGTETALARYDGAIHGFATFPVPMRDAAIQHIAQWLQAQQA